MTELLTMIATPVWVYLAIFGLLTVDAVIPVIPVQAVMITSGALTVYGDLNLVLVIAIGALGMLTGDSIAFLLGRSTGHVGRGWLSSRLRAMRTRYGPRPDDELDRQESRTRRAAVRFTRGLRRPGPLVLLLCRFVPGGRMAAGFHAGRTGYPIKLFLAYDGAAAIGWATYGGLVGHVGGTAITDSAWRPFAIAATAAAVFGTAGWILALFGGRAEDTAERGPNAGRRAEDTPERGWNVGRRARSVEKARLRTSSTRAEELIAARAASADAPPPRSIRTTTGRW